ncbi:MAG: cytochrome c oxidase accessory protein CcoG [Pseudomonadaceae bacterium]|nr:cytochrome c oxidase accessory protein CcoG [Pseudomonadaceae bacterium]
MNADPNPKSVQQTGDGAEPITLEGFGPKDLYQKREKIFTRFVGGFYQRLRFFSGWPLLLGYFLVPLLNWGDRQAILFDLPARQFHFFGLTIWPQDFWLLGWLLMIAAFGLFTVTTVVGRLWCGYTCPQTVWTAIFMWIEQFAEGPRHQRMRLDQAPMSFEKLRKRTVKHVMWLGFAALTGIAFVSYFVPVRELIPDLLTFDVSLMVVSWIVFFTLATYINAGWMREQVCKYMCPYARFQSAMFDKDTLIVSYDERRGETRGSRKRGVPSPELGDCIDCQLCVQVCPTGIDIRDGLQYECIGCAHCIDACNQVMDKMGYEPGLVRYTTFHALEGGEIRWLRARSIGYALICLVLIGAFIAALLNRSSFAFDVLRDRGELYHESAEGIRNDYQLKIMNKTQSPASYEIAVESPDWVELASQSDVTIEPGEVVNLAMSLRASAPVSANSEVVLKVCRAIDDRCVSEETRFLSPMSQTGAR